MCHVTVEVKVNNPVVRTRSVAELLHVLPEVASSANLDTESIEVQEPATYRAAFHLLRVITGKLLWMMSFNL